MLVSTYHLSDTARANARRQWVEARPVVIGRAPDCHVVLDDPAVADYHLRATVRDGALVIETLDALTLVDNTPAAHNRTLRVGEGRPIQIGNTIVRLRMAAAPVVTTGALPAVAAPTQPPPVMFVNPPPTYGTPTYGPPANPPMPVPPRPPPRPRKPVLSTDPTEQDFLTALRAAPHDSATRMVYADWLEERGFKAKCELVRLREHLDTFVHRNASDVDWRAVVARTPIDHCNRDKCPRSWDALQASPTSDFIRGCPQCARSVTYCAELRDAYFAAWHDLPVVFDAELDRIAANATYSRRLLPPEDEELDDDPDGYTLDAPPSTYRR